jgi:hypothetical protein
MQSSTLARSLKVLGYVLVTILLAVIVSPEFREWVQDYPEVVALLPVINVLLAAIARELQKRLPEDNVLQRAL